MSAQPRMRARRPRRNPLAIVALLVLIGLVFAFGVALGQALEENPRPGGTQTSVRTLKPVELPAARETVTVTVSRP